MTATSELPLVVADKEPSLPKEIGKRLLDLAKAAQLGTNAELAGELKVSVKTVERLSSGESSLKFGRQFRALLVKKGVKGAAQLSLDPDGPGPVDAGGAPFSDEEWARIGRILHGFAPQPWFSDEYTKLKQLADALEIVERQVKELGR